MKSKRSDLLKADARILIILMGSLGDVVRGLALVGQIKRHFPAAHITWLVEEKCHEIVKLNAAIDEIILFNRKRGLAGFFETIKKFKTKHFDLCLDLQRHAKSGLFSLLSGANTRIGFHRNNSKEFNWLFNNRYIKELSDDVPKLRHYLAFIEELGLPIVEPLDFGLKHIVGDPPGKDLLSKFPPVYVVLVLGSSWNSKDWLFEGYKNLIPKLLDSRLEGLVLIGDRSQENFAKELEQSCSDVRVLNYTGKTSLKELVIIISAARYCIGPDSGPSHIAGALNVKYISLFGPTSALRTAPYGSENLVVQSKLGCVPCYRRQCPGLGKLCMRLITADHVMEKVKQI